MSPLAMMETVKEFATLFNTALLVSILGLLLKVFQASLKQKETQIDVLRERLEVSDTFSVGNVVEQFRALKEYYHSSVKEWYDASLRRLEEEYQKAMDEKKDHYRQTVVREIAERKRIMAEYRRKEKGVLQREYTPSMAQVCGRYSVVGKNFPYSPFTYIGTLDIRAKGEVLDAKWVIGPQNVEYSGYGVSMGNSLAIAFEFDLGGRHQSGVVLYELLSPEIMRGVWTQPSTTSIGTEECRRVSPELEHPEA